MHLGGSAKTRVSSFVVRKTSQVRWKAARRASRAAALLFLGTALATGTAFAATDTWNGSSTTTNWSDSGNWSSGVPGANAIVVINQTGANAPSNYDISQTFGSVTFDTGATITNAASNIFGIASGGFITDSASSAVVFASNTPVTLNGSTTINVNSGSLEFGGGLTGTGPVVVNNSVGAGALIFLGNSNYSGGTTIQTGSLQLGDGTNNGTITGDTAINTGASLAFDEGSLITYGGNITGGGAVTVSGPGTVVLIGIGNSWSGGTTINATSTLQIGSDTEQGSISAGGAITDNGVLDFHNLTSNNFQLAGLISGTGSVAIDSGTVIYTNTNSYSGGTTIGTGATLQIGTGLATGGLNAAGAILDNGTLTFSNIGSSAEIDGGITGTGALNVELASATDTLILTGTNSYSGGTNIISGTLQIGTSGTPGTLAGNVADLGTLDFNNVGISPLTFAGSIQGTGSLQVDNGAYVILTNTNNFVGTATTGGTTINSGGTLQIGDGSTSSGSLFGNIVDNGTLATAPLSGVPNQLTLSGNISGSGGLTQMGPGTTILSGTNSYNGTTTVQAGTLELSGGAFTGTGGFTVDSGATLTFAESASTTFANTITGAGNLSIISNGAVVLTGNNSYTGGTTIAAGSTLQIGNGGTTGSIADASAVTDNGTLIFDRSGLIIYDGNVTGTGALTQSGTGALVLNGTNTYSGGTNIASGIVAVFNDTNIGTGAINFTSTTANGSTLAFVGSDTFSQAVTLAAGGGTFDTNGYKTTWSGLISGSGALTVQDSSNGAIALILTAAENYTGGTTINASGKLQLGNGMTAGSITGAVTDNGAFVFDEPTPTTFAGDITGGGYVSQQGGGTLALAGMNGYTGGTFIGANSTISVANDANLGDDSGAVYMAAGSTLAVTATGTYAHQVQLVGDPTIQVKSGTTATWTGQIIDGGTPVGTLDVAGGGTLVLADAANSYSGGTVITGNSTLSVGADGDLGNAAGGLTLGNASSGGTLDVSTGFLLSSKRAVTLGAGGGTIETDAGTFEIAQGISGTGGLTVSGAGAFILAGTSSYTGNTMISSGATLQLGDGTLAGAIAAGGTVNDNGSLVFNEGGAAAFSNTISGSGSVTQDDTTGGTLTFTGADSYAGATNILSGVLQLGDGTNAGTVAGNIVDNSGLIFNEPSNTTFGGIISGTGPVTVKGTKTLILTGNNTYTGTTTINSGATLQVGNGGATGSISASSGVVNNGVLTIDVNGTTTLTGGISGAGAVNQIGSGTTILTGTNTYSGATTITSGAVQIGNNGTSGTLAGNIVDNASLVFNRTDTSTYGGTISGGGTVTVADGTNGTTILTGNNTNTGTTAISSGTLQIGNGGTSGTLTGNVSVTNNANLAFSRSDSSTYGGVISGAGAVTVANGTNGTTILTGNNTYTGTTTISSGALQIGNGGTSGALAGNVIDNSNIAFDRSDTATYAGVISGSGSLTEIGTGTTTLTGDNTYTGGTTISAGTLQLGNATTTGSIGGNVTDNGTLDFDRSNSYTFGGVISGSGGVTQSGAGQTTLIATETYIGATTVTDGTLLVNGSIASSSGTTVGTGGAIGGIGTISALTINSNGTVAPGSGGVGTLTVNGNFILGPGATYMVGVTPTSHDLLAVNGTALLEGGLTVTPTGTGFGSSPITILSASNGISGTFSSFTVFGGPNQIPLLSYTADDVYLTFAPTVTSLLPTSSASTNQSRVADAIDFALTHDNAIAFEPVTSETGTTLTQSLSELSGETAVAFQNVAVTSVASFMNTLFDPSIGGRGGLGAGIDGISNNNAPEQLAFNGSNSDAPYHHPSLRSISIWTNFYGAENITDGNTSLGTHRTSASEMGGTVGLDYRPKKGDGAIGIAFGISGNNWSLADQLGKGNATAYQVGAYYSRDFWHNYFTAGLSYARYIATTDRTVVIGGGTDLYHADFDSNSVAARAEVGHVFNTSAGRIAPYLRFQADDIGVPHYAETTVSGSPAFALTYTGKQHYDYTTELGSAWSALIGPMTDLHARLGWLHDYAGGLSDIATFDSFNGASFTVDGTSPPRDAAHAVLGIAHNVRNVVLALNGEAAVGGTSTIYGGTASISFRW